MAYINLLPWREAARREKQKQYLTILSGVSAAAFLTVLCVSLYYGALHGGQQKRNAYLKKEIAELDQKIVEIRELNEKKTSLQQRMSLIEQLQGSRNLGTIILAEVANVVPAGVYLTGLEKKGSSLKVVGKSESNNRLTNMMRKVEQSTLLSDLNMESIVAGEKQPVLFSDFIMQLTVQGYEQIQGGENETKL